MPDSPPALASSNSQQRARMIELVTSSGWAASPIDASAHSEPQRRIVSRPSRMIACWIELISTRSGVAAGVHRAQHAVAERRVVLDDVFELEHADIRVAQLGQQAPRRRRDGPGIRLTSRVTGRPK